MQGQKQIFWEEEIHVGQIRELDQELDELETEIKQLKSNQMVFPKNAEAAKRIIYEELKQQGDPDRRAAICRAGPGGKGRGVESGH